MRAPAAKVVRGKSVGHLPSVPKPKATAMRSGGGSGMIRSAMGAQSRQAAYEKADLLSQAAVLKTQGRLNSDMISGHLDELLLQADAVLKGGDQ